MFFRNAAGIDRILEPLERSGNVTISVKKSIISASDKPFHRGVFNDGKPPTFTTSFRYLCNWRIFHLPIGSQCQFFNAGDPELSKLTKCDAEQEVNKRLFLHKGPKIFALREEGKRAAQNL